MPILSRERRKIYMRRIRNFWQEFRATRIGVVGLVFLLIFIGTATFAPWLTPYDPRRDMDLAESFAMPEWLRIFPQYKDLPPTIKIPLRWTTEELPFPFEYGKEVAIRYRAEKVETIMINLTSTFSYDYRPPDSFDIKFLLDTQNVKDLSYLVEVTVIQPNGTETRLWSYLGALEKHRTITILPDTWEVLVPLGLTPGVDVLGHIIFADPGTFKVVFSITLMPTSDKSTIDLFIKDARFTISGLLHGILGTEYEGRDIFSQLVYGARISLAIGLLSAIISTSLGILVGVISGYMGGIVDEISMRIVDILLCLPVLPLLLALIFIFEPNVAWIIVLIAVFGWQGLSRMVRSQVLSLRESAFVECAVAAGASKNYVMLKHLIPNVLPIAFASLVLSVPGAILTEASLSFLGIFDPRAPTWGKMLYTANEAGAFGRMAWWWILPPGIAITIVCLSFVFIGHAVDNIVNPRLRRRR